MNQQDQQPVEQSDEQSDQQPNQQPAKLPAISDDLPKEMIVMILRQLNLPDLIHCRCVSKRFRDLIDYHLKVRDLVLFNYDYNATSFGLSFVPPVKHLLQQSTSNILRSPSFKNFFSDNLRLLAVYASIDQPSDLDEFGRLEKLYAKQIMLKCELKLSLPELRVLAKHSIRTWN